MYCNSSQEETHVMQARLADTRMIIPVYNDHLSITTT